MKPKLSILISSMASGGAERAVSNFLPSLIRDFEVTLFLFTNDIHYKIPQEVSVITATTTSDIKNMSKLNKLFSFPKAYFLYKKHLSQYRPDVSLSLMALPNFMNASLKKRFPDIKFILSERCFPSIAYKDRQLYRKMITHFYNKADCLFSNSLHINKDLKDNFGVKLPMHVVYNPVQQNSISNQFFKNPVKLIQVGSLREVKNQKMMLNAIKHYVGPEIEVNFYGTGNMMKSLKEQSAALKNVFFHGNTKDVKGKLHESNIFTLTSNSEGFPNALLEAISVGLPVIATNCKSGPLEILNDNEKISIEPEGFYIAKYGILVNVNDSKGLARAIEYLVNNPEKAKELGEKGHLRSRDFSIDNIYNGLYNVLLEN